MACPVQVAKPFTKAEIDCFLAADLPTAYWMIRKAAVCISFDGGLRGAELCGLDLANFEKTAKGFIVKYTAAKQDGETTTPTFLLLINRGSPQHCMAKKVGNYFEKLKLSLGELPQSGPVFYGNNTENSGYVKQPMGQHYLSQIGKNVADFFGLQCIRVHR